MFQGVERGVFDREDILEESITSISETGHMTSHHRHMGNTLEKRKATADMEGVGICMTAATHGCGHTHSIRVPPLVQRNFRGSLAASGDIG